jgi:hypothetical protein
MPRRLLGASITLAAIALGGCGSQRAPSSPTSSSPSAPTTLTVTNFGITGFPPFLRIGGTATLTATATFSDGSSRDVPASWSTSNPRVAQVHIDPATGRYNLLTSLGLGEADITATQLPLSATAHIVVRDPASLQEISGVVHEAGARASLTLPDVRVQISGGSHDGMVVVTDEDGRFDFPDIFDADIDLWASRPGYQTTRFRVALLPRDKVADIGMLPTSRIVEQVFHGTLFPDCVGRNAGRSLQFTPRGDGVLLVSAFSVSAFESGWNVFSGSTGLNRFGVDELAVYLVGGVKYELRVDGDYCGVGTSGSFHVVFTRPE